MSKTVAMTAKFTEKESNLLDAWAESRGMTRSAAIHELVVRGIQNVSEKQTKPAEENDVVRFLFKEDYTYFWKGHEYAGFVRDDEAHIRFGGEWMIYPLSELPAEIVRV